MARLSRPLIAVLILIIVAVVVRMVMLHFEAQTARTAFPVRVQCSELQSSLGFYKEKFGHYPEERNGLELLLKDDECRGMLKITNLFDPWGTPLRYRIIGGLPKVESAGSDKKFDTSDDVHSY